MTTNLKIFPFALSLAPCSKTDPNIESGREVKESIAILTEGALLFTTIIKRMKQKGKSKWNNLDSQG